MSWKRNIEDSLAPSSQRLLVSDGETQAVALKTSDESQNSWWIFDNPHTKDMKILWWRKLPKNPPQINTIQNEQV